MIPRLVAAGAIMCALCVGTLAGGAAPALADASADTTDCSNVAPGAAVTGCPYTSDDPSDPGIPGRSSDG